MDIERIAQRLQQPRSSRRSTSSGELSFSRVLDQATGKTESHPMATAPTQGMEKPVFPLAQGTIPEEQRLFQDASHILELLDDYTRALGDSGRTLRSIEPTVLEMEKELDRLDTTALGRESGLAQLVDAIAIAARVEAFKFRRGDYVA